MTTTNKPTLPTHIWTLPAGTSFAYFEATGHVCMLAEGREVASNLLPKYMAPPGLVWFSQRPGYTYIYAWDELGHCYALDFAECIPLPRADIGSLEMLLAEIDEREAAKLAEKLARAQAERAQLEAEIEARRAELDAAQHALTDKADDIQRASGELGQAKKAAKASRKVAEDVTRGEVAA